MFSTLQKLWMPKKEEHHKPEPEPELKQQSRQQKFQAKYIQTKTKINEIQQFSNQLYETYAKFFLDPKFSQTIGIQLANDLYKLDVKTLNHMKNDTTPIQFNLFYQPPKDYSKFIINAFEGGLNNILAGQLPSNIIRNNRSIPMPKLSYIQKHIKSRMNEIKQKWEYFSQSKSQLGKCIQTSPCILTKDEIINEFVQHFIIRGNLIGAIQSVLVEHNHIEKRIDNLYNGTFCLPPNIQELETLDEYKRVQKILFYLQAQNKNECIQMKGTFAQINQWQQGEIMTERYWDFVDTLETCYHSGIQSLREILQQLMEMKQIHHQELNALTEKTRQILDDLYMETEVYYLLAVLSYLEIDSEPQQKQINHKRQRREILLHSKIL